MLLLPPTSIKPVIAPRRKPTPTHVVTFYWTRSRIESERHILGNITVSMVNQYDENDAVQDMRTFIESRIGRRFVHSYVTVLDIVKESNRLSDLERMRRKWNKVMRAYYSDRSDILTGKEGMFTNERLAELDALLEQAQAKVERTYGHKVSDLEDQNLAARARELDQQGMINHFDHHTLS